MRMRVCYLRLPWSWTVLLPSDTENLLRPLQLFHFHLWHIYWLSLVVRTQMCVKSKSYHLPRIWAWHLLARRGIHVLSVVVIYTNMYIDRLDTPVFHTVGCVLLCLVYNTLSFLWVPVHVSILCTTSSNVLPVWWSSKDSDPGIRTFFFLATYKVN
jgi:hypothetical protein